MGTFYVEANGVAMGTYSAADEGEALNSYARDAGYKSYEEVANIFGDDAVVVEIDTDALCEAVEKKTGHAVFQDAYGGGVAIVNNVRYATWGDLALLINQNLLDFRD